MWKANKTCDNRFALTMEAAGALSNSKVPHLRHLLEWVLEARANKWFQRAPAQLFVLKEEQRRKGEKRKQERTTWGDQA